MTHKATLAVRTGIETDQQHGAVVPPIYLSSNYTFADFGEPRQYDYARSGNPTRTNLADALAALEGGAGAVVTGTGMGAVHLVTTALLKAGDLLIAPTTVTAVPGACSSTWRPRVTTRCCSSTKGTRRR